MADDITARILLSVEYADAVQKCKDVEVGLEDVTKARQSDLDTVKAATNATNANAQAMEREAEAAKKVAKAETDWAKDVLKQRRDFEKFVRDEERKEKERAKKGNPAAQAERDRQRVMRETQREQTRLAEMSNAVLDEEIKDQKILIAEKRKQLAIEREILLQRKLNDVRDQLETPSIRKTPGKYLEALQTQDTLEQQSMRNTIEILNAERDLRKAHKTSLRDYRGEFSKNFMSSLNSRDFHRNSLNVAQGMQKITKTMSKANGVFQKAAQGIGRSLGHIARIGGRGLGMEMTTEGITGAGGAFMAGSLAIGGIAMLGKGIMDLYRERRTNRIEDAERNLTEMRSTTDRMQEEAEARQKSIDVLKDLNNSENLSASQRVTQGRIIADLNKRLKGMTVEVDSASGRIKNLGVVEENILRFDTQNLIERKQQEMSTARAELAEHEKFLREATRMTQVYDMDGIKEASAAQKKLSERILELQKSIGNLNKTLTPASAAERSSMRNAKLNDAIAKDGAILKSFRFAATERRYEMKWAGNAAGRERFEAKRDAALIKNLREQRVKEQSELDKIRSEYIRYSLDTPERTKGLERYYTQQKKLIETTREIDTIEQRIHARKMRSIEEPKKEQTPFAGFMQRESFKYRDTTTAAVMANSMEGLRLQSRMLMPNTPEQKTLKEAQKQTSSLVDIRRLLQNIKINSTSGVLQFKRV